MSTAEVLKAVRKMSVKERVKLVDKIWDTIEDEDECYELTESEWKEVYRRLKDIEAHPEKGFTWEEVEAEIRAKRNGSFSLTESQRKDLARRVAKYRSGKAVMIPWEDVKAEIEARLLRDRSDSKKRPKRT